MLLLAVVFWLLGCVSVGAVAAIFGGLDGFRFGRGGGGGDGGGVASGVGDGGVPGLDEGRRPKMTALKAFDALNALAESESDAFAVKRLTKAVLTLEDERDAAIVDWREAEQWKDHWHKAYRRAVALYEAYDGEMTELAEFVNFNGNINLQEWYRIRSEWDYKRRKALEEAEGEAGGLGGQAGG